ncbi:hypothetical protein [Parabacteroides pacaensis]|uniref:hypothetical protein n=1 Tax=Parabacteroides pacaensis TaxID=2086575 RepID=UPI000D0FD8F1|nr:hypothetical protein [Parabacteroides pacaensis]
MRRLFIYIVWVLLVLSFIGCRSRIQYIPVESVRTEYKDRLQRDSIYFRDSIIMREKGDTVFIDRWRYLYKDRLVTDTLLVNDTIRVPYSVEKELTRWQKTKMDVGGWAIGVLSGIALLGIGYVVIWLIRKKK